MIRHATRHIFIHGLMAVAVVIAYASSGDPTKASHALSGQIHVGRGLAVFPLLVLRLPLPDAHAAWARLLGSAHQTLGNVFIWLAGLHAEAALVHHYVLRYATLVRILPGRC